MIPWYIRTPSAIINRPPNTTLLTHLWNITGWRWIKLIIEKK